MVDELKAKGIVADESMHPATLSKMLRESEIDSTPKVVVDSDMNDPSYISKQPESNQNEGYMKISDVKSLIAEALAAQKAEGAAPIKVKRVTEHTAHVWRLDGKWVVDFKDRNVDEYVKEKIHAYQRFNEQKREFEAWVELVFEDGTTKDISLPTYVKNRVLVYCPIVKRHKTDKSYSVGEVEKKKEVGDKLVGTGVLVDQEVEMYSEVFEVKTPDGKILHLPDYIIA